MHDDKKRREPPEILKGTNITVLIPLQYHHDQKSHFGDGKLAGDQSPVRAVARPDKIDSDNHIGDIDAVRYPHGDIVQR